MNSTQAIAFAASRCVASGDLAEVALKVKPLVSQKNSPPVLVFDATTSEPIELDLRGNAASIRARIEEQARRKTAVQPGESAKPEPRGPARPKLGVVGGEVTLLPRHWEWLNAQPGGASATLRKMVELARKSGAAEDRARLARESAYRFMRVMAGNEPGFEEATRVLFAKDTGRLRTLERITAAWPKDVRKHSLSLVAETIQMERMALRTAPEKPSPSP